MVNKNKKTTVNSSPWTGTVDTRSLDQSLHTEEVFRSSLAENPDILNQVMVRRSDNMWILWTLAMWDSSQVIRSRAIEIWEKFATPEATSAAVVEALHSLYPDVKVWAAQSMITQDDMVTPAVAAILHDASLPIGVRSNAANVLSGIAGDRAFNQLVAALNDDNPTIRAPAAMSLGRRGDKKSGSILIDHLSDPDPLVCEVVIGALGDLCQQSAVSHLINILSNHQNELRKRKMAVSALGKIRDPRSLKAILNSLADEEPIIRQAAALAVGDLDDRSTAPARLDRLSDPNHHVRATIFRVLGRLGDPVALDAIYRILAIDSSMDTRTAAAEALGS